MPFTMATAVGSDLLFRNDLSRHNLVVVALATETNKILHVAENTLQLNSSYTVYDNGA